ncbi:MAG: hypothetical protein AB7O96_01080 [Pseudobdellovibrionaceae bacterium]
MAIAKDLLSKANSAFVESTATPAAPLLVASNPDGSSISGSSSTLIPRSEMAIPYDLVSKLATAIIESTSTPGQAALVIGNSDGSNL